MMVLVCFLDNQDILFWKPLDGKSGSILENRSFLGDLSQALLQSLLSLAEYSCLIAEALTGRGECNKWGRSAALLDLPCAAAFANLSTASLPFTLL